MVLLKTQIKMLETYRKVVLTTSNIALLSHLRSVSTTVLSVINFFLNYFEHNSMLHWNFCSWYHIPGFFLLAYRTLLNAASSTLINIRDFCCLYSSLAYCIQAYGLNGAVACITARGYRLGGGRPIQNSAVA